MNSDVRFKSLKRLFWSIVGSRRRFDQNRGKFSPGGQFLMEIHFCVFIHHDRDVFQLPWSSRRHCPAISVKMSASGVFANQFRHGTRSRDKEYVGVKISPLKYGKR